jgi:hypothetical protein
MSASSRYNSVRDDRRDDRVDCCDPLLAMAQTVKMRGTVAPGVSTMAIAGRLDPAKTLTLDMRFASRNRAQLDQLIAAQMDRGLPNYHQWITPDEFTRRFGATDTDFCLVKNFLAANGFQIIGGSREEGYIRFSGDAGSVERAFNTQLEDFGNGKFANLTEPEIPAQFADLIRDGADIEAYLDIEQSEKGHAGERGQEGQRVNHAERIHDHLERRECAGRHLHRGSDARSQSKMQPGIYDDAVGRRNQQRKGRH